MTPRSLVDFTKDVMLITMSYRTCSICSGQKNYSRPLWGVVVRLKKVVERKRKGKGRLESLHSLIKLSIHRTKESIYK